MLKFEVTAKVGFFRLPVAAIKLHRIAIKVSKKVKWLHNEAKFLEQKERQLFKDCRSAVHSELHLLRSRVAPQRCPLSSEDGAKVRQIYLTLTLIFDFLTIIFDTCSKNR